MGMKPRPTNRTSVVELDLGRRKGFHPNGYSIGAFLKEFEYHNTWDNLHTVDFLNCLNSSSTRILICNDQFQKLFPDCKLKPGQKARIRVTMEVIEEPPHTDADE